MADEIKDVVSNNETNSQKTNADTKPAFNKERSFDNKSKFGGKKDFKNGQKRRPQNRDKQFEEKVVKINRVTKVTKGGRRFRFAAVVVIGDKKGNVGMGTGKANEVPDAIKKAVKDARKSLIKIPFDGTTVPHDVIGHFGSGRVMIKPAKKGTGVIAGGPSRAVMELAGISDVYAKSLGSNTPINMIRATLDGLSQMLTKSEFDELHSDSKVIRKPEQKAESTAQ